MVRTGPRVKYAGMVRMLDELAFLGPGHYSVEEGLTPAGACRACRSRHVDLYIRSPLRVPNGNEPAVRSVVQQTRGPQTPTTMGLLIFLLLLTILCVVLDDGRAWDNVTRSVRNDLVFEGRHQGFAPYVVKRDYDRRFVIALFTGIGVLPERDDRPGLPARWAAPPVPPAPPAPGPVIDRIADHPAPAVGQCTCLPARRTPPEARLLRQLLRSRGGRGRGPYRDAVGTFGRYR